MATVSSDTSSKSAYQMIYPDRYYAQYDPSNTSLSPITAWWDMWSQSCALNLLPPITSLLVISEADWEEHLSAVQTPKAVKEGKIVDYDPPAISPPLKEQAQGALQVARAYVSNNYTMLNEPTPDNWVAYLKALMAITKGSDTTSTVLPTSPSV